MMKRKMFNLVLDEHRIKGRYSKAKEKAQKWLDNEVLKDSEPYVPRKSGMLVKSGVLGTKLGSGKIIYNQVYARAQYYGLPNKSKAVHPKATKQWFESAKAEKKSKWLSGVKKIAGEGMQARWN